VKRTVVFLIETIGGIPACPVG